MTPSSPCTALLVVHTNTFFVELFRLSLILSQRRVYRPVFMFYPYPTSRRDMAKARKMGFRCLDVEGMEDHSEAEPNAGDEATRATMQQKAISRRPPFLRRLWSRLYGRLARYFVFDLLGTVTHFRARASQIAELLRIQRPAIIALGGDMTGYDTSVFVKAAHRLNIPVVIVPSTMSNGLEQAEFYYNDPLHRVSSWWSRVCAGLAPSWVFVHKGRKLLRERPARALAMELCGLAPPLPWIFNSGYADAIALESEAMRKYYLVAGLPDHQLVVTGSPADDAMAEPLKDRQASRQALCKKLGLAPDRGIILTALPPDFLYVTGGRPQCDFQSYAALVDFWMGTLYPIAGFNKVVCLHPSVAPESMKYIERDDVRIALDSTAELIPLCDLYIASVSSTIRWAIACGRPVINYDVYRYQYTDYRGLKGVVTIEEQDEFVSMLRRVTSDAQYYEQLAREQATIAEAWGRLDGHSGERLHSLFDRLVDGRSAISTRF